VRRAALWIAALVVVGCRTVPAPPILGVPIPADDPRPQALLERLGETAASRHSMRGSVRLSVDSEELTYRGSQRVAASRPARLRVEILGLFSQVAAVLTTDGRIFQFLEAGAKQAEIGPVRSDLLWRVARIDLEPREAVAILIGATTPGGALELAVAEERSEGVVVLRLDDARGNPRQRLSFDAAGLLTRTENWDAGGEPTWEARFSDYDDRDGSAFANRVDLEFPRTGASARVQFGSVELNPTLPDELFFLRVPKRVSSAGGGGGEGG